MDSINLGWIPYYQEMARSLARYKNDRRELVDRLKKAGVRVKIDDSDKSPGWKFSEQEMRGIPLRVEIGPKDIEAGK